jgi:hypothetical protein
VLVYDRLETPRLYRRDTAAVLPIEGILAAISVKSTADKSAVKDACDAAEVLRNMERRTLPSAAPPGLPGAEWPRPAVFLFGFKGLELETLRTHLRTFGVEPGSPRALNGVCVLESGLVVATDEAGAPGPQVAGYRVANAAMGGAWGLFISFLWTSLVYSRGRPTTPNLLSYLRAGELLDPSEESESVAHDAPDLEAPGVVSDQSTPDGGNESRA